MANRARPGRTAADRIPEADWPRTWALTAVALVVILGAWELGWRSGGWVPAATDPSAWTMVREGVGPESTVLVGSSRMQADLDPDVWAEATGGPAPRMLALFGATPLPSLEHVAAISDYHGTVIVDFFPGIVLNRQESETAIRGMIDAYDRTLHSPGEWTETRLGYAINPELVLRRSVLSIRSLAEIAWDRAWPEATFEWPTRGMKRNRFFPMDFPEGLDGAPAPRDLEQLEPATWDEGTDAMFERVERATRAILDRGGRVVFVHFPHCGGRRMREERIFPRAAFWDRFADRTSGETLHFADVPSLAGFDCPDGSHLDRGDTGAFTRALVAELGLAGAAR